MANQQGSTGLSERLRAIAEWIQPGARVLDVGTDHALLPIHLVRHGQAEHVIAADVAPGPYETAKRNVERVGLDSRIEVRLGNGLTVVRPREVDTVVVAGMGGGTIADILDEGQAVLSGIEQLLLQPMNATGRLRKMLRQYRFVITGERLVDEADRVYQMVSAKPAPKEIVDAQYQPYIDSGQAWLAFEFGPINLHRRSDPLVSRTVQATRIQLQRIVDNMPVGATGDTAARREILLGNIREADLWLASG